MKKYFKSLIVVMSIGLAPVLVSAKPNAATMNPATATATVGARDIVQEIINVIGLKPRFELRAADIDNAAAVVYGGKRYILYNERFLAAINNAVHTDWGGVSILAHEIGHHLNGHTLARGGSNPADELEADEFSGFVLRKMGASLAEAQAAINLISEDETSSTHPGRNYRLAAISKGWRSANEQLLASAQQPQPDQRAIATKPSPRQTITPKQHQTIDSRFVLTKIYFTNAPNEEFYLTTRYQLVHVSDEGVKVIGKLARTNNPNYPYYFESEVMQSLFITQKGVIVNRKGERIGYFT